MDKDFNERRFKERMRRAERFNDRFWPVAIGLAAVVFIGALGILVYLAFDPETVSGALTHVVEGRHG